MRRLRRRLSQDNPEAAAAAAMLLPSALIKQGVVAGYAAIGGEFDPGPVMRRLADAGARLALPAIRTPGAALEFLAWLEGDPLMPDALGVPAPLVESERLRP